MQRYGARGGIGGIAELMNRAASRIHIGHRARRARMTPRLDRAMGDCIPAIKRFFERAIDHRIAAPCPMTMHRARLPRLPDERGDRVTVERVGGEQMTAIVPRIAHALIGAQQTRIGDRALQREAHALAERRARIRFGGGECGVDFAAQSFERGAS